MLYRNTKLRWIWRALVVGLVALLALSMSVFFKHDSAKSSLKEQAAAFEQRFDRLAKMTGHLEALRASLRRGPIDPADPYQIDNDVLNLRRDVAGLQSLDALGEAATPVMSVEGLITYISLAVFQTDLTSEAYEKQVFSLVSAALGQTVEAMHTNTYANIAAHTPENGRSYFLGLGGLGLLGALTVMALIAAVRFEREIVLQRGQVEAEKKIAYLADFDSLTGLAKREHFYKQAASILAETERALVLVNDVDDFKGVNDRFGHDAGDAVLRHVADAMQQLVREHGGIAARLGGDEFALVIPGPVSSMRAGSICESLIAEINKPLTYNNVCLTQKASIGVAISQTDADLEANAPVPSIMKSADLALYQAKREGKNTYAFYDSRLAAQVARRRELEAGISDALENGGFHLNFQPQVDMESSTITGFEALARWSRGDERISPGEFIPVAEDTGQVVDIDLFALKEAVRTMAKWRAEGHTGIKISTNLSALHFRSEDIVMQVQQALEEHDLPGECLTLEVTESVMIESIGKVVRILKKLRDLGVGLALDDFGTGYSSLAYLRTLPIDYIKIDQSFVRDLDRSEETRIVMRALVGLAQGINRKLVVEGIETNAQADVIRELGCDHGQGYLFGKPLPEKEAHTLLERNEPLKSLA